VSESPSLGSDRNDTRTRRLGALLLGFSVLGLAAGIFGLANLGFDIRGGAVLAIAGVLGATGIGLVVHNRFARMAGIPLFALLAATLVWGWGGFLLDLRPHWHWSFDLGLLLVNSTLSTALLVWLNLRAIQILCKRERFLQQLTSRLVGGFLLIIGLIHLNFAYDVGVDIPGYQFSISHHGTNLFGFPGWPYWHAAISLIGIFLIIGWQRRLATLALAILSALLCPLLMFATWDFGRAFGHLDSMMFVIAALVPLLFAYLSWWLWRENCAPAEDVVSCMGQ